MPTESWVVAGPQVIELDRIRSVRVQVVGGRVDVVAREDDSPHAVVEVHAVGGRPLEVSLVDGELRVGYAFTLTGWEGFADRFRSFSDRDSVSVHLSVPRDVRAKLGTVSAEGLLSGVREDAQVATVSGSLVTDSTWGALAANTVSGEVIVRGHTGDLRVNTVSGDVTASGAFSRVSAKAVSGSLVLDVTSATSALNASSVSGDVTVRLPAGTGVSIDSKSVGGRVVVDRQEYKSAGAGRARVDLRAAEGGCFITTSTVSGHLTVLRGTA